MDKKTLDFENVPDVQACLAEIRAFLNAVQKEQRTWPKALREQLLRAHFACNLMIMAFDPEFRYQTKAICLGELPRRPKPVIGEIKTLRAAEACPTGLPRRPPR